jgi:hypothetical protein
MIIGESTPKLIDNNWFIDYAARPYRNKKGFKKTLETFDFTRSETES